MSKTYIERLVERKLRQFTEPDYDLASHARTLDVPTALAIFKDNLEPPEKKENIYLVGKMGPADPGGMRQNYQYSIKYLGDMFDLNDVDYTAMNAELFGELYVQLDSKVLGSSNPPGLMQLNFLPSHQEEGSSIALAVALYTEKYLDMSANFRGSSERLVLRVRGCIEDDAIMILGLVELDFATEELQGGPVRRMVPVNLGTFKLGYPIQPSMLAASFVSAVDELVDSGVGIDLICPHCPKSYDDLDAMSSDRLCLIGSGMCAECLQFIEESPSDFSDAAPMPF